MTSPKYRPRERSLRDWAPKFEFTELLSPGRIEHAHLDAEAGRVSDSDSDAQLRVSSPEPASQSLMHTESDRHHHCRPPWGPPMSHVSVRPLSSRFDTRPADALVDGTMLAAYAPLRLATPRAGLALGFRQAIGHLAPITALLFAAPRYRCAQAWFLMELLFRGPPQGQCAWMGGPPLTR